MNKYILFLFSFLLSASLFAQEYKEIHNLSYYPENQNEGYIAEKCKLDIHYPENAENQTTILWFHGGGMTQGAKEIPQALKQKGYIVVGAGHRLSPQVSVDEVIQDAALSYKWVVDNIKEYGGDPSKIVISGHSAGGYLALMLGFKNKYLKNLNLNNEDILGVVPFSPQTITHFTARKEQGIEDMQPIIDSLAPLYWVSAEAPPVVLITGDREMEMLGRYEENAYLERMLKLAKHRYVKLYELDGYGHDMTYPAFPILLREIKAFEKISEEN